MSGAILLVGTMILLGMRRIYFDQVTKQATSVKIPILGGLETQTPVLVLFFFGAILLMYPIYAYRPELVTFTGHIASNGRHVKVLVVPQPAFEISADQNRSYVAAVPMVKGASYQLKFVVDDERIFSWRNAPPLKGGAAAMTDIDYQPPVGVTQDTNAAQIKPIKEVSDATLANLGILQ